MGPNILVSRPRPVWVTWRFASRDHLIPQVPFPIGAYCNRVSISNHFRDNGHFSYLVTTLTFLGHVTSSVTWPFDSPGATSYRCSIVTESLSPTIFDIIGIFHIWVTTLTFLGHVMSSVTWPIDPPYVISYWCPIVTKPLSLTVFEILGPQIPCAHTHTKTPTHAASDFIFCPMQCIALDRQL